MSKTLHKSKCSCCLLWLMWEEDPRVCLPLFGTLKFCGIILLWDEECFRWIRCSSSSGQVVRSCRISKWINQALVGLLYYGTNTHLPSNTTVAALEGASSWCALELLAPLRSARQLDGIIPELCWLNIMPPNLGIKKWVSELYSAFRVP